MEVVKYTEITTLEGAYAAVGKDRAKVIEMHSGFPDDERDGKIAQYDAETVVLAINEGKLPDVKDPEVRKYWIWWRLITKTLSDGSAGVGLSLIDVGYDDSDAGVGARQLFNSDAQARHAIKYFTSVFEVDRFGKQ